VVVSKASIIITATWQRMTINQKFSVLGKFLNLILKKKMINATKLV
jgi:hypothetical protein